MELTIKLGIFALLNLLWLHQCITTHIKTYENSVYKPWTKSAEALGSGRSAYQYPFQDPSLPWQERVDDLVGRLSMDELVNLTTARYGHAIPGIDRLDMKPAQYITECLRGVRRENATAFPQALGLAASFSRDLLYKVSEAVATEVRAFYNTDTKRKQYGVHGLTCFSPVINILRHPFWGRNQETYGEDPYLSGQLGMQFVRGLQGDHPRYVRAAAGCKHYDAHSGPENIPVIKFGFNANITERDLQMTYLPQFKACVQAEPYNIMCSFNSINGVPSCANKHLLTDILRTQWGYKGFVVSDDGAVEYVHSAHHYVQSFQEAAVSAVKAGCNVELTDGKFTAGPSFWTLNQAVKAKVISEQEVRDNVKSVLYTRMRLGEFDPPTMNPFTQIDMSVVLSASHLELATQAAIKSFVLMKNLNNILPLKTKYQNIAIVGPMTNDPDALMGDYPANPPVTMIRTPLQGLRQFGAETRWTSGCSNTKCQDYKKEEVEKAVTGAQVVFVCLGTGTMIEAEHTDRVDLSLPGAQLQILQDAFSYSKNASIVLLLFNAGPLDISWAKYNPNVHAILECFFPAMVTGDALYRVLTNQGQDAVPAGRLPVTWPANLNQVPPMVDYSMEGRTYRYFKGEPLYPFGYGLSYTKFKYSEMAIEPSTIKAGSEVRVKVTVSNVGQYDADEVVQLYLSWQNATVPVPTLQLAGFQRLGVSQGRSRTVVFVLTSAHMALWLDPDRGFQVEKGDIAVYVGGQQPFQTTKCDSNVLVASLHVV